MFYSWERLLDRGCPNGGDGTRRKRTVSPELTPLEGRSLLAVVGLDVMAHPATLPPGGGTVEVTVMASFTDTTPGTLPSVSYQVTDEYGQVQPVGLVTPVRQPGGAYSVSFPVELEAKVRGGDTDGRRYTASVTVGDDGTGQTESAAVVVAPPASRSAAARFEVRFLRGMIPHHQMAVGMSQIALRNSSDPTVQALAQRIIRAQGPEIAAMQSWLRSGFGVRNFRPRMTAADVQMLRDLQGLHGTAFDKAYLSDMVEHHRMAITGDGTMPGAEDVLARGFHPRILKLAGDIVRTQTAEIQEMRALLGQGTAGMTAMPNM